MMAATMPEKPLKNTTAPQLAFPESALMLENAAQLAALAAFLENSPPATILLVSPPGAGRALGVPWWQALQELAGELFSMNGAARRHRFFWALDCADSPAFALQALQPERGPASDYAICRNLRAKLAEPWADRILPCPPPTLRVERYVTSRESTVR
ncbi:hypothetical protein E3E12_01325 [Formicincola oecophyllae]|uniref:Uncharacterized protein n=1 Tax=Formicincola oecophyllae TaxID=2558361 RepID=A0A4Y6U7T1_9PROT|nr:hypothetical protein [Formicincola oecophyllae]QDH13060.1 hypothetical protein E3E12_01325 [Formicincola oecophyllae]